jgi:hypothetical protein
MRLGLQLDECPAECPVEPKPPRDVEDDPPIRAPPPDAKLVLVADAALVPVFEPPQIECER